MRQPDIGHAVEELLGLAGTAPADAREATP